MGTRVVGDGRKHVRDIVCGARESHLGASLEMDIRVERREGGNEGEGGREGNQGKERGGREGMREKEVGRKFKKEERGEGGRGERPH